MMSNAARLMRVLKLVSQLARHRLAGNKRQFSQTLFDAMFELGGVYIKFLQALLIRSDLFSDQYLNQQIRVYEEVDIEPIDLEATLLNELGLTWKQHFNSVTPEVFAAGSFGQVYRAELHTGQAVIIKVLRPRLTGTLTFDLRLLGLLARLINVVRPSALMLDVASLYRDFRDSTIAETNYRREAAFAAELYERYRNHPIIHIPKSYLKLSTSRILVQDFVGGISISQLLNVAGPERSAEYVREHLGSDLDYQLQRLGSELLYATFMYPSMQGDPHPGNIKLLPDNRVGLIDFGLIAEPPTDRAGLFNLVKEYDRMYNDRIDVQRYSLALLRMFSNSLMRAIDSLGEITNEAIRAESLLNELALSAENTYRIRGAEIEHLLKEGRFLSAFNNIINENNRFGLQVHIDATNFIRSTQMFLSMTDSLGRKMPVMRVVYRNAVIAIERDSDQILTQSSQRMSHEQAIEVLGNWLDRVAIRDPFLFGKLEHHLHRKRYYV